MKKILKKKDGAALVITIIIGCVMIGLSMAMLLANSSLSAVVARQRTIDQCKELTKTLSRVIEKEICINRFDTYEDQNTALLSGKYPLWFYLRAHIWQDNDWSYLNEEVFGHGSEFGSGVYREFKMDESCKGPADDVTVQLFWEADDSASYDAQSDDASVRTKARSSAVLGVRITTAIGNQKSTITTRYQLVVDEVPYRDVKVTDHFTGRALDTSALLDGKTIRKEEVWSWTKSETE